MTNFKQKEGKVGCGCGHETLVSSIIKKHLFFLVHILIEILAINFLLFQDPIDFLKIYSNENIYILLLHILQGAFSLFYTSQFHYIIKM